MSSLLGNYDWFAGGRHIGIYAESLFLLLEMGIVVGYDSLYV